MKILLYELNKYINLFYYLKNIKNINLKKKLKNFKSVFYIYKKTILIWFTTLHEISGKQLREQNSSFTRIKLRSIPTIENPFPRRPINSIWEKSNFLDEQYDSPNNNIIRFHTHNLRLWGRRNKHKWSIAMRAGLWNHHHWPLKLLMLSRCNHLHS